MPHKFRHEDVYTNSRFAGQVRRFHTWPVRYTQSNGEHTWQVMRIWFHIFGPLNSNESTYLLWHDAGELYTGDIPGMVKSENPEVKATFDIRERSTVMNMSGPDLGYPLVVPDTKLRAKVCDIIELLEYGMTEVLQGNRLAEPIVAFATAKLAPLYGKLTRADFEAVMAYIHRMEDWYNR